MKPGDRVSTPDGNGTVVFTRNGPPNYDTVAAVSVLLDSKKSNPTYSGSTYSASAVLPLK